MQSDFADIYSQLQCCHSILNTAWPKPGVPQMTGASGFIGTNVFRALRRITLLIKEEIADAGSSLKVPDLARVWGAFEAVVERLEERGRQAPRNQVDRAFNLLYLASCVLYRELARAGEVVPKHDPRFSHVEELGELLSLCAWKSNPAPGKPLINEIEDALRACLSAISVA